MMCDRRVMKYRAHIQKNSQNFQAAVLAWLHRQSLLRNNIIVLYEKISIFSLTSLKGMNYMKGSILMEKYDFGG